MKKILFNELSNLNLYGIQGGSWNSIYTSTYNGEEVIVKAQNPGSLKKTNKNDDRFEVCKRVYEMNLPAVVKCYGYGDDFAGERFVVLEKLEMKDLDKIPVENLDFFVTEMILAIRKLYLKRISWLAQSGHILVDKNNNPKMIDFNDDSFESDVFFNKDQYYDFIRLLKEIIPAAADRIEKAIAKLIEEEYQSLDNVHQPIYIKKYSHFLRRENDPNDKRFGELVPPVRECFDRAELLDNILKSVPERAKILDIGCNVGWFCFYLQEKGFDCTGIDLDDIDKYRPEHWKNGGGGKIEFAKFLAEILESNSKFCRVNVNIDYIESMDNYDVVIAFSVLHLYFSQHKYTKKQWLDFFQKLSSKVNQVLIIETDNIKTDFEVSGYKELMPILQGIGGFASVVLCENPKGTRPMLVFRK